MMKYHLKKRKPIAGQSAMGFLFLRLATAAGGKTSVVKTGIPKLLPVPIPVSCAAANQSKKSDCKLCGHGKIRITTAGENQAAFG